MLARGLLDTGWSAGATVALRIAIAAAVLVVPGALALRGRWHLLRANAGLIAVYGVAAVAGAQLCYFYAVTYMQVSVALLLEYTAPVAVVVWLWLRHGHRPSGADPRSVPASPRGGLVLVLDVISGAELSAVGVLWALGAMVGAATYFVISADEDNGLPGITLAAGRTARGRSRAAGGRARRACCRSTRPRPTRSTTDAPSRGGSRSWRWAWSRRPSPTSPASRPAVGSAAGWRRSSRSARSWPRWSGRGCCSASCRAAIQLAGGLLVLAGVVVVKLGEGRAPLLVGAAARRGARQRASCRLRKTSRCSSRSAAATGTASRAPMTPISDPPTSAATTVTEPGRSTDFFMIRG